MASKRTSPARPKSRIDAGVVESIRTVAEGIHGKVKKRARPELVYPTRSLSNVRYDPKTGFLELGRGRSSRSLSVNTVKTFAQTLRLMALSKSMVAGDDFATKREAYYVSKNWQEARFREQPESDAVMDDIEAMFALEGVTREQMRFYPEEHGGTVVGPLVVIDRDPRTGETVRTDCANMGSGGYTIPHSVEHLQFEAKAKFVLAIETGGMFQRLNYHKYWRETSCVLVEMAGVPTRATRRFVRRLADDFRLPVYAFVDCDPYGISNIYRTLKVGSGNAAHINRFFCVPQARYLGVTPHDIVEFKLQDATHPLAEVDVKRAKDALKNDPFFKAHKPWIAAIEQMLKTGVRAEQQALAKWGLNYVISEYLPRKLKDPSKFLP